MKNEIRKWAEDIEDQIKAAVKNNEVKPNLKVDVAKEEWRGKVFFETRNALVAMCETSGVIDYTLQEYADVFHLGTKENARMILLKQGLTKEDSKLAILENKFGGKTKKTLNNNIRKFVFNNAKEELEVLAEKKNIPTSWLEEVLSEDDEEKLKEIRWDNNKINTAKRERAEFIKNNPGMTYKDIAKELNVALSTIVNTVKEFNLDRRNNGNKNIANRRIKVIKDNPEATYQELAAMLNLSTATVYRIKKENGLV